MNKTLKILALMLATLVVLGMFAGCKPKKTQGSSSVATQSEVAGNNESDSKTESGVASVDTNSDTESKTSSKNDGSGKPNRELDINKTGWPIVNKPITFTIMGQTSANMGDPAKMSMFSYMAKKTNISIKYVPIQENNIRERKTLALQSGDLPDAFAFTYNTFTDYEQQKYASEGAFINIMDDLKTYAPHIYKELEEYPIQKALNVTENGELYTIPNKTTVNETSGLDHFLNINKTWLDNLGLDIPKTTTEFLEVMREFRDGDPNGNNEKDEIPFGTFGWSAHFILSFWGSRVGTGNMDVDNNYKAFYPLDTPNAKAAAQFWYDFVQEDGLMDITIPGKNASGGYTEWRSHINTGKVGCFWWSQLSVSNGFPQELLDDYVAIEFPTANFKNSALNLPKSVNPYNYLTHRGKVIVTKACKNVPALLRYFDYLYTDEGIMVGNYGDPSNGLYKQLKDGNYELTEKGKVPNANYKEAITWHMALPDTGAMEKNILNDFVTKGNEKWVKYRDAAQATYKEANKKNPKIRFTELQLTANEVVKLRKYSSEFNTTAAAGRLAGYVTSKTNAIEKWVTDSNNLEAKGLSGYIALYQGVVNRNKQYLKPNV